MADYFSRLANRALGIGPIVRPDIVPDAAFRFHAAIPPGGPNEEEGPVSAFAGEAHESPREQARVQATDPSAHSPDVVRPTPRTPASPSSASKRMPPPVQPRDFASRPASVRASEAEANRSERPSDDEQRTSTEARVASSAPLTAAPREIRAASVPGEGPSVRVTIGRIEVRAATPAAQPAPRITDSSGNRLRTLDSYLRERNRGRE